MHKITLFIFAAVFAVALAEGQYYVPRAYYTIDAEGHESARVPLRRLRRSVGLDPYREPYPWVGGKGDRSPYPAEVSASATSNAYAGGHGGHGHGGGYNRGYVGGHGGGSAGGYGHYVLPGHGYGSSNPKN